MNLSRKAQDSESLYYVFIKVSELVTEDRRIGNDKRELDAVLNFPDLPISVQSEYCGDV